MIGWPLRGHGQPTSSIAPHCLHNRFAILCDTPVEKINSPRREKMRGTFDRVVYDLMYRLGKPVWDTGSTPPEVVESIAKQPAGGRALDLGCGTGTHSIYLAQHGWGVVGVDFSAKAIAEAREKAKHVGVNADFRIGDVTRLDPLSGPFDFALDVGCFHGLHAAGRARYVEQLTRLVRSGGKYTLWAFDRRALFEDYGISPHAVEQLFSPQFEMSRSEQGTHRGRPTTWYWFTRR
jgi:SAM-dependent methyltransferase